MQDAALVTDKPYLLHAAGLTKAFGSTVALENVSLSLRAGQVHCLLGENGAGKSTLCNLVAGSQAATAGSMLLSGEPYSPRSPKEALRRGVAMVHQHFSLIPTLSALDNLLVGSAWLSLRRQRCAERAQKLIDEYGFDLPLSPLAATLSIGQLQQLEIVKCLLHEPQLLILDEPTAVLTPNAIPHFVRAVRRIAATGVGVVLVTHKLQEIEAAADWVSVLRLGQLVDQGTLEGRAVQSFVTSMIGSEGTGQPQPRREVQELPSNPSPARDRLVVDGATVVSARGIRVLDTATLIVREGEIVGIAGVEGNGQSELAAVMTGALAPTEGRVFVGRAEITRRRTAEVRAQGVAIIPEDRHQDGCIAILSLAHNLFIDSLDRFSHLGRLDEARLAAAARQRMADYDIRAAGPEQPFGRLSGGNQQKAVLARELSRPDLKAVIAVHPTRGLDFGAVQFIYRQLLRTASLGAAIVIVSSELDELMAHCDRVVVFFKGRIVGSLGRNDYTRDRIGALMAGVTS